MKRQARSDAEMVRHHLRLKQLTPRTHAHTRAQ
jgi:hypothetical protein